MEESPIYEYPSVVLRSDRGKLSKASQVHPNTKTKDTKQQSQLASQHQSRSPKSQTRRPTQLKTTAEKDEQVAYYEATPELETPPSLSHSRSKQKHVNTNTNPGQTVGNKRNVSTDRNILLAVLIVAALSIFIALVALVVSLWSAFSPPSSPSPGPSTSNGGINKTTTPALTTDCPNPSCSSPDAMLASQLDALSRQLSSLDQQLNQEVDTFDQQVNQRFLTLDELNQRYVSPDQLNQMYIVSSRLQGVRNNISSLETSIQSISNSLQLGIRLSPACATSQISQCGPGNWIQVAFINMTASTQQCPSAWREYTSPVRTCGRATSSTGSCSSVSFNTCGRAYSRVCGRIIGYQYGTTDAFSLEDFFGHPTISSLNDIYVDGISVTHGRPTRTHIWTFAAGHSISASDSYACPCESTSAYSSPSFIGNSYFCESGASNPNAVSDRFHTSKVWDGAGCTGLSSCCTFNSPPWFSVRLASSTTNDIDVRICGDEASNNEDTPIELLEIYVQ